MLTSLLLHSFCAVACTVKKKRSFSSVTVSLIVEVTVEKQRSAPGSAALKTARIRCTKSTCNVQQLREPIASDVVVSAQQSQPNCLFVTEMSTVHTSGSHMSCEMTTWHTRPSSRPPHHQGHPVGGLVMVRVDSASCIIFTFSLQTPCTSGASFSSDTPFLGRLTQETRACGFIWRVLAAVTRLASVEQYGPRREDDGIGHKDDGLPGRRPGYVPAVPDEPFFSASSFSFFITFFIISATSSFLSPTP